MFLWKVVEQLIGESVLKSSTFSQTWNCNALECKRPYSESLNTSRVWSPHTNVNLKLQNWWQAKALVLWLLDVCSLAEMLKNLDLKVSNIQISQPTERIRNKLCTYIAFSLSKKYFHQKKGQFGAPRWLLFRYNVSEHKLAVVKSCENALRRNGSALSACQPSEHKNSYQIYSQLSIADRSSGWS